MSCFLREARFRPEKRPGAAALVDGTFAGGAKVENASAEFPMIPKRVRAHVILFIISEALNELVPEFFGQSNGRRK
jgi:hypothetical protein